jgi:putative RNA 2'-phosphotransferase
MSPRKVKQQRLSVRRFLAYMLGHRPDEFGLVPDEEGYIPIKDVLMALSEEEGWGFVRKSHIEDLLREREEPGFEINNNWIRLIPGSSLLSFGPYPRSTPPKTLYYAARRKAYAVILEQGLTPGGRLFVPLTVDVDLAMRMGRRRDPSPILLTIHAARAYENGIRFSLPQEMIYLVDQLPLDFFTGPPLPKEKPIAEKKKKEARPDAIPTPGSFLLNEGHLQESYRKGDHTQKKKKGDVPDWKRAARKERRKKEQMP